MKNLSALLPDRRVIVSHETEEVRLFCQLAEPGGLRHVGRADHAGNFSLPKRKLSFHVAGVVAAKGNFFDSKLRRGGPL